MRLALIAGRGHLPSAIARAQAEMPIVAALEGFEPEGLSVDMGFRLETLGSLFKALKKKEITDVCLCGAIERPEIRLTRLDARTWRLVPSFLKALKLGDDGALRILMELFEKQGFTVRGADELLPDLTLLKGIYTATKPSEVHESDVALGDAVLHEMGRADLGQACVVALGQVVAREDENGTDALLRSLISRPETIDESFDPLTSSADEIYDKVMAAQVAQPRLRTGGILFKAPKPGQDRRADLPTIGPGTAMRAAEAGLDGIVIEEGGVIVLDRAQTLAILDAMGMFLWVREAS